MPNVKYIWNPTYLQRTVLEGGVRGALLSERLLDRSDRFLPK